MDVSFDIVIFPGGVPMLGDVHLKNVVFLEGNLQRKWQIMGRQGEPLSKQQGVNINFVVFEKNTWITILKLFFLFPMVLDPTSLWVHRIYPYSLERIITTPVTFKLIKRSPRLTIRLCNSETVSISIYLQHLQLGLWRQHCSLTTFDFPSNNTCEASQWPLNLFQFLAQLWLAKTALLEAFHFLMVTYRKHNMACRTIISELAVAKVPAINDIYHQNVLQVLWQWIKRRRPIIVFLRILLWCTTCKNKWIIMYVLLIAWNLAVTYFK